MNSYTKLVEIIGQKRTVIDKLRAELAPLEEILAMLERDYDEISSLRLQVRTLMSVEHHPLPAPEPEQPATPAPEPATAAAPPPLKHATKQQRIFDALTRPMTCGELREAVPDVKAMESTLKVLRAKKVIEIDKSSDGVWPPRYMRVNGVTGVPKLPHGTTA